MADWTKKWYKEAFQNMEVKPSAHNWDKIEMHMSDWVGKWYTTAHGAMQVAPSSKNWERIDAALNDWLKKWYVTQQQSMDVNPDDTSWQKVNSELEKWPSHWYRANAASMSPEPKSDLWDNIDAQMTAQGKSVGAKFSFKRGMGALALFVLIPLSFYHFQNTISINVPGKDIQLAQENPGYQKSESTSLVVPEKNQEMMEVVPKPNDEKNSADSKITTAAIRSSDVVAEQQGSTEETNATIHGSNNTSVNSFENDVEKRNSTPTNRNAEEISYLPNPTIVQVENFTTYSKDLVVSDIEIPERNLEEVVENKKWGVSASIRPQLSTLFNSVTLNAIRGSEGIALQPGTSISYSLGLNRYLSNNDYLSLSFDYNNRKKHVYSSNYQSAQQLRTIDLNYNTLVLSYHRQLKSIQGNDQLNLFVNAGVYASYLNTLQFQGEFYENLNLNEGFANVDYGINIGLRVDYELNPNLSIFAGIQNQSGLVGIFEGTEFVPADFFNNFTNATGIQLGLVKKF